MVRAPIIPERDAADLPFPADGMVIGAVDMIGEEIEEFVRLDFFQLSETSDEAGVDIQGF